MLFFHSGGPIDLQGPPADVGPGRPMPSRFDGPSDHPRIPHRGAMEPQGPMMGNDGPIFAANEPEMRRLNDDFRGPPMEHDHNSRGRAMPIGAPPIIADRSFEVNPRLEGGPNPGLRHGRAQEEISRLPASHEPSPGPLITPRTPPRHDKGMLIQYKTYWYF